MRPCSRAVLRSCSTRAQQPQGRCRLSRPRPSTGASSAVPSASRFLSSDVSSSCSTSAVIARRPPQHRSLSSHAVLVTHFQDDESPTNLSSEHFDQTDTRTSLDTDESTTSDNADLNGTAVNGIHDGYRTNGSSARVVSSASSLVGGTADTADTASLVDQIENHAGINELALESSTVPRSRSTSPYRGKGGIIATIFRKVTRERSAEDCVEAADLLLQLIEASMVGNDKHIRIKPGLVNNVLNAGLRHRSAEFAERLTPLMDGLEQLHALRIKNEETKLPSAVNVSTYQLFAQLELWKGANSRKSLDRVEDILDKRMSAMGLEPNEDIYTALIKMVSCDSRDNGRHAPLRCEKLLKSMKKNGVEPTTDCYNACLNAWAKSGRDDATERAEKLLLSLQEEGAQPDFISFTTMIDCFAKSGEDGAAQKAEDVLHLMQELSEEGMTSVGPNTVTYNAVINAYSKSSKHTSKVDAAHSADRLLKKMKDLAERGNRRVAPDRISYTACINAYSKVNGHGCTDRAIELLREMETRCKKRNNRHVNPDLFTYNAVLRTFCNQIKGFHSERAEEILQEMEAHPRISPDILSYNSVILSCVLRSKKYPTAQKQKALQIAVETFGKIRRGENGVEPTPHTFANFFKLCETLAPQQRDRLITSSFLWCCELGQLNEIILQSLKDATEPYLLAKLLNLSQKECMEVRLHQLPKKWSRNHERPSRSIHYSRKKH